MGLLCLDFELLFTPALCVCVCASYTLVMAALLLRRPSIGGGAGIGGSANMPPAEAPPQVKLGRVPKNARLIEAMAQHKNAKPKPKGWLMAVVDSIYKEGMCLSPHD
jgi:hypothetical protein